MGLDEKIASAKESTWLKDFYTDAEWEKLRVCAGISVEIEMARMNLGMNQKEFAKFMGVSQGMISKWESGDYNFTIEALARIGSKLGRSVESFLATKETSKYTLYTKADDSLKKQPTEAVFIGLIDRNKSNEMRSKNKYCIPKNSMNYCPEGDENVA